jgi:monofunctional glycosyltransferase
MHSSARRRSRPRRLLHGLRKGVLLLVAASVSLVVLYRFVPPAASGLMVQRRVEALVAGNPYERHYHWEPIEDIAPVMGVAVIAGEDQRFARHFGFDWEAIEKAAAHNERNARKRGASTISQQTAKNLFLWSGRNWVRKGLEAYFTVLIEMLWPKERILEVYLNIAEFGDGVYGVEAAAQHYFGKPARTLRANEAALLAAVLPSPHRYHADRPSPLVRARQAWILQQMQQLGGERYIEDLEAQAASGVVSRRVAR